MVMNLDQTGDNAAVGSAIKRPGGAPAPRRRMAADVCSVANGHDLPVADGECFGFRPLRVAREDPAANEMKRVAGAEPAARDRRKARTRPWTATGR